MKKHTLLLWVTAILLIFGPRNGFAKEVFPKIHGNGHITKSTQTLPAFDAISANAIDDIILLKSDGNQNSLIIETDDNLLPYIHFGVKNGVLSFNYKDIKPTKMKFYIMVSSLTSLKASGASKVETADSLSGEDLLIRASGASWVNLNTYFHRIHLEASGAADVFLAGTCQTLMAQLSGASDLKAVKIRLDSAWVKASGASTARVNVAKYLNKDLSGVATVKLATTLQGPEVKDMSRRSEDYQGLIDERVNRFNRLHFPQDTTRINIGAMKFEVVDGDSTRINVGNHTLLVTPHGDVRWRRNDGYRRFKGHWGGFDLGLNGYVNSQGNANFGNDYDYLSLDYGKSVNLNFNIYQQNIALNKARTIGLITGLGLSFNEYRFAGQVYLDPSSHDVTGYYIVNTMVKKSKLSVHYADIPLILEFQTNNPIRSKRFFVGVGVIGNVKLRSRTKLYFTESNAPYALQDPATGQALSDNYRTPDQGPRNIVKKTSDFGLNPFRLDATVRFGYRLISLYGTYALTPMFQAGRGPDLRQWSLGITLVKW